MVDIMIFMVTYGILLIFRNFGINIGMVFVVVFSWVITVLVVVFLERSIGVL